MPSRGRFFRAIRNPFADSSIEQSMRVIPASIRRMQWHSDKKYHSAEIILGRSRRGKILVVEREGTPVANGSITGGEISGVFVDPAFHHAGIGAKLMLALEGRAAEIALDVSLPSRGFYERLGYAITAMCAIDVREGEKLDNWQAKKLLVNRHIA
jgi:GNAT superfamily N-acetyltransferase